MFLTFCLRYCARVDSISISGPGVDDKWRLTRAVTVHRPYKMEVKAKLETIKGAPFKWTAADNDGRFICVSRYCYLQKWCYCSLQIKKVSSEFKKSSLGPSRGGPFTFKWIVFLSLFSLSILKNSDLENSSHVSWFLIAVWPLVLTSHQPLTLGSWPLAMGHDLWPRIVPFDQLLTLVQLTFLFHSKRGR